MMLAFGFSANAQQKKAAAQPAAKKEAASAESKEKTFSELAAKDVIALGEVIEYTGTQERDFKGLFEYKYRMLSDNLSEERKSVLAQSIEMKIRATLSADQNEKLSKRPDLINKLSH